MRIPRSWVPPIAKRIVDTLLSEELIVPDIDPKQLGAEVERLLTYELMAEDRINDEVRKILREHELDIDRGGLDYRKVFDLTKQKLIKEKGIIV
jgi:hypothetical protein